MQVGNAQKESSAITGQDAPIPVPQQEPTPPSVQEEAVKVSAAAATLDTAAPKDDEAPATTIREKTPEGVKQKKEVKILEVPQTLEGKSADVTEDEEEEEEEEPVAAAAAAVPKPEEEEDEEEEEEEFEIPVRPPTPPKSKVSPRQFHSL